MKNREFCENCKAENSSFDWQPPYFSQPDPGSYFTSQCSSRTALPRKPNEPPDGLLALPSSLGRVIGAKGKQGSDNISLLIFCVKIILHSNCVLQSLCLSGIFTKSHCILYSYCWVLEDRSNKDSIGDQLLVIASLTQFRVQYNPIEHWKYYGMKWEALGPEYCLLFSISHVSKV